MAKIIYFALSFYGYYEVGLPHFLKALVNKGLKSARNLMDAPVARPADEA